MKRGPMTQCSGIVLFAAAAIALAASASAWAQQPTQAQASAIRSACRSDYMSVCSNVPTGGAASLQCLEQHAGSVSEPCRQALAAVRPPAGSSAAPPAAAGAAPPMSRREMMTMLRNDCGPDYRTYCRGVEPGGGRALECLRGHGPQLSQQCRSALSAAHAER